MPRFFQYPKYTTTAILYRIELKYIFGIQNIPDYISILFFCYKLLNQYFIHEINIFIFIFYFFNIFYFYFQIYISIFFLIFLLIYFSALYSNIFFTIIFLLLYFSYIFFLSFIIPLISKYIFFFYVIFFCIYFLTVKPGTTHSTWDLPGYSPIFTIPFKYFPRFIINYYNLKFLN